MTVAINDYETITDFVTGRALPNVGAETNRQMVEKFLVRRKGFNPDDIHINFPIAVTIDDEIYRSRVDLVLQVSSRMVMAVKCAAGSLGSRQREILAAARLLTDYQIPISIVSNGETAIVLDTLSGKEIGNGLDAIPSRKAAEHLVATADSKIYPEERWKREAIIFRSYDGMNVNVIHNNGSRS